MYILDGGANKILALNRKLCRCIDKRGKELSRKMTVRRRPVVLELTRIDEECEGKGSETSRVHQDQGTS
jgi:hypothetical protein